MPFLEEDTFDIVGNTREDWRRWRESSSPVYDAVHVTLELVLVLGVAFRFISHFIGHAIYRQEVHGDAGGYEDNMFGFNNLVAPVLTPEHWHQEALMRALSFSFGLSLFGLAATTTAGPFHTSTVPPVATFWTRVLIAGYLLLDPVLGVAWRLSGRAA